MRRAGGAGCVQPHGVERHLLRMFAPTGADGVWLQVGCGFRAMPRPCVRSSRLLACPISVKHWQPSCSSHLSSHVSRFSVPLLSEQRCCRCAQDRQHVVGQLHAMIRACTLHVLQRLCRNLLPHPKDLLLSFCARCGHACSFRMLDAATWVTSSMHRRCSSPARIAKRAGVVKVVSCWTWAGVQAVLLSYSSCT